MYCFKTSKKKINEKSGPIPIIADVGSGNGVPGLIWAICDDSLNIVLIEKNAALPKTTEPINDEEESLVKRHLEANIGGGKNE